MIRTTRPARAALSAALLLLTAACGGRTGTLQADGGTGTGSGGASSGGAGSSGGGSSGGNGSSGASSGGGGSSGAGSSGGGGSSGTGTVCVDIQASSFDTSCHVDSDCVTVATGYLCPNECLCGGTPINVSGQAQWEKETAILAAESDGGIGCDCPASLVRCVAGTCTTCDGQPNEPPGCEFDDGGVTCVDIPSSAYATSCNTSMDCTSLPAGTICDGQCSCGGGVPANVASEAIFNADTAGFTFQACPCPPPQPVECVAGACTQCDFDSDGGISCGDGG